MKQTIETYFREIEKVRKEMTDLIIQGGCLTAENIVTKSQELDELLLSFYTEDMDTSA